MGLTIHYDLRAETKITGRARLIVRQLHHRAMDLPFNSVGDIVSLHNREADIDELDADSPHRRLLLKSIQWVEHEGEQYRVKPKHVIAFTADPGDGAEQAHFGLAAHYPVITGHDGEWIETGLGDWMWSSYCTTQHASHPKLGGFENFLQSHLAVIRLLDMAKEIEVLEAVHDNGGYWERRDVKTLETAVNEWNSKNNGFAGEMMALLGLNVADFEQPDVK